MITKAETERILASFGFPLDKLRYHEEPAPVTRFENGLYVGIGALKGRFNMVTHQGSPGTPWGEAGTIDVWGEAADVQVVAHEVHHWLMRNVFRLFESQQMGISDPPPVDSVLKEHRIAVIRGTPLTDYTSGLMYIEPNAWNFFWEALADWAGLDYVGKLPAGFPETRKYYELTLAMAKEIEP